MGDTAWIIAIGYLVVLIVAVAIALGIAWSTLVRPRLHADPGRLAHRERIWFVVVIGILAVLLLVTIPFAPYGQSASSDAQVVKVTASQFLWRIEPDTVRANRQVEFRLDSTDVNHGFGLYDSDNVFLKQIQVVPDKESRLLYTFDKPGVYKVLCLEFCGLDHHVMESTIRVTQ